MLLAATTEEGGRAREMVLDAEDAVKDYMYVEIEGGKILPLRMWLFNYVLQMSDLMAAAMASASQKHLGVLPVKLFFQGFHGL